MTGMKRFLAATVLAATSIVVWGCGDPPAGPSPAPSPSPTVSAPAPTATPAENPPAQPPTENPPTPPPTNPAPPSPAPPVDNPPAPAPAPAPAPGPTPPGGGTGPTEHSCFGVTVPTPINGVATWDSPRHYDVDTKLTFEVRNVHSEATCDFVAEFHKMASPYMEPGWRNQTTLKRLAGRLAPQESVRFVWEAPCDTYIQGDMHGGSTLENMGPHSSYVLLKTPACTPPPTPTCEAIGLKLNLLANEVITTPTSVEAKWSLSWSGSGSVTVNWGDGTSNVYNSPGTVSHTYPRGTSETNNRIVATYNGESSGTCTAGTNFRVFPPPPPPPPCESVYEPRLFATGSVVQTSNKRDGARVTVSGTYQNIRNEYVGILWRNGNSKYVKDFKPLNAKCEEGKKSFTTMNWTSYDLAHLPSNGGRYSIIRFKNGDRDNPDIVPGSEVPIQ